MSSNPSGDWGDTPVNTGNINEICRREVSVELWDSAGNPRRRTVSEGINSRGPGAQRWLLSSAKWDKGFPQGWVGVKVLGAGGFGIAGHWSYCEAGPVAPGSVESKVRDIVVKQGLASHNHGLRFEAIFQEQLTRTGSQHFPRLYGRVQRDVGLQAQLTVDRERREVHRIFMEYCPGGSLGDFLQDAIVRNRTTSLISEPMLWSHFHCLAKAVAVMHHGHEKDPSIGVSGLGLWMSGLQMVHFDLKPLNTLIAERDKKEHRVGKRLLVADFGMSALAKKVWDNDVELLHGYANCGTVDFRAPEQQRRPDDKPDLPLTERMYGACTNIYQVGCIMYCLIVGTRTFPSNSECFTSGLTSPKDHETIGRRLEDVTRYSDKLRALVLECLFQLPRHRPSVSDLLKRTLEGLRTSQGKGSNTQASRSAHDSEAAELTQVRSLLLEQWHGPDQDKPWRRIIPGMQTVVNRRRIQMEQICRAMQRKQDKAAARNRRIVLKTRKRKSSLRPAGDEDPVVQSHDPRPRLRMFHRQGEAKKAAQGEQEESNYSPSVSAGAHATHPYVIDTMRADAIPADTGRPPKRHAADPDPAAGRPLSKRPRSIFNPLQPGASASAPAPGPAPLAILPILHLPVRIWPGAAFTVGDLAVSRIYTFAVPWNGNIATLRTAIQADPRVEVVEISRFFIGRPGSTTPLLLSTTLSSLGFNPPPATPSKTALECFRRPPPPTTLLQTIVAEVFTVEILIGAPKPSMEKPTTLTLRVMPSTSIRKIKEEILERRLVPEVRMTSQLRIAVAGAREGDGARWDCDDERGVKGFFAMMAGRGRMVCEVRPVGEGGSGTSVGFDPAFVAW